MHERVAVFSAILLLGFCVVHLHRFRSTRIRASLYLALGGLLGVTFLVVTYLHPYNLGLEGLAVAAVLVVGWGIARMLTIDRVRLRDLAHHQERAKLVGRYVKFPAGASGLL